MFAVLLFFFFNDTATTEIYTLSLHDALPISAVAQESDEPADRAPRQWRRAARRSLHVHEQPLLPREARLCHAIRPAVRHRAGARPPSGRRADSCRRSPEDGDGAGR